MLPVESRVLVECTVERQGSSYSCFHTSSIEDLCEEQEKSVKRVSDGSSCQSQSAVCVLAVTREYADYR